MALNNSNPNNSSETTINSTPTDNNNPTNQYEIVEKSEAKDKTPTAGGIQILNLKLTSTPLDDSNNTSNNTPSPVALNTFTIPNKLSDTEKWSENCNLTRKLSYKAQRQHYCREKQRVTSEVLNSVKDTSMVLLSNWLKIRGTLKSWTKLWCVLKPGILLLYKNSNPKSSWVGTIVLSSCKLLERPSKKDGFCFKLYNPLDQSIWAPRGPENEAIGAVVQPLPSSYSIFRDPSEISGRAWMEALQISMTSTGSGTDSVAQQHRLSVSGITNHETQWSELDCDRQSDHDCDDQIDNACADLTESESDEGSSKMELNIPMQTPYVLNVEEEFGDAGEQTEELAEENKSLIWYLVKQVRPGMDLSKVVLPTFILQPRSFLDKLTDSYYHVDILSEAVQMEDPYMRMKSVVKWYLSGFYKKPKGLKKPYNPILGETFRCYWQHSNGSKTFYIAEQVSHHPPISAFYVSNRQDGFSINASILARSKFYGNSTAAILDGTAVLTLLPHNEKYTLTVPYAHCKGILLGTLTMELGGKVSIECEKNDYFAEIEFKLKPFLGGIEQTNCITGKLKCDKEVVATFDGHWDGTIYIRDKQRSGEPQIFWESTIETRKTRLPRYTVPVDKQTSFESEKLWQNVSEAILSDNMAVATVEKTALEEAQRARTKERKTKRDSWMPIYFQYDLITSRWIYNYVDLRPWNPASDLYQYENNYIIQTQTKHSTLINHHLCSSDNANENNNIPIIKLKRLRKLNNNKKTDTSKSKRLITKQISSNADQFDSGSSMEEFLTDTSHSNENLVSSARTSSIMCALHELECNLNEHNGKMMKLQKNISRALEEHTKHNSGPTYLETVLIIITLFFIHSVILFYFD